MRTTRLRATLREVEPKVERVIEVPAAITLDDLHEVLQVALGWTNSHLHQFRTEETTYAVAADGWTRRCSSPIWSGMRVRLGRPRGRGLARGLAKGPRRVARLVTSLTGSAQIRVGWFDTERLHRLPTGIRADRSSDRSIRRSGSGPRDKSRGPTSLIPDYAHS